MMYQFVAKVSRTSEEEYEIVVEAADETEALDLAEATLEDYPQGRSSAVRYCLRTSTHPTSAEIVDIFLKEFDG